MASPEVAEEVELDVLESVAGVVMTTQREEDDRVAGSEAAPQKVAWPGSGAA